MPKTVEAMIVHAADMTDAHVKNFMQSIEEGRKTSDDDWMYMWDPDVGHKRPVYLGE